MEECKSFTNDKLAKNLFGVLFVWGFFSSFILKKVSTIFFFQFLNRKKLVLGK